MLRYCLLMSLVVCTAILGCGSGKTFVKHYPVKGKVTLKGNPVTDCTINFTTQTPQKGMDDGYSGKLNENGEFTISSTSGQTGAPAGKYKITLYLPPEDAMSAMMGKGKKAYEAASPFPPEYASPSTSTKEVEVKPEPNDLVIEL